MNTPPTGTTTTTSAIRRKLAVACLYAGGFLGPFGGGITTSMLPELGGTYGIGAGTATSSLTAYLVPFAVLMLVSGTLGARWGARRSIRTAYLVYIVSSLFCAIAGTYVLFLGGRVIQGAANAFTTPLLLTAVAAITPRERLGRTLGLFGSLQAAGQTSAPLLGGLAAEAHWQWAFVGVAVVAGFLAVVGLPADMAQSQTEERPRLRTAWRGDVLRAGIAALVGWACLGGLSFMVALRAQDRFGLGAAERGLALTAFGVLGLLSARLVGRVIDRIGGKTAVVIGSVAGAVPLVVAGLVPSVAALIVAWALCGIAAQFVLVGVNTVILSGTGPNKSGAVSVVQAFRFTGAAGSPVAFTPVYHLSPVAGFLVPAALLAVTAPLVLGRARAPE
ncbi:MFS transporter [Labedaea rhizosphaerae]|uniref:Putative MFS family arabinose efflux permease n=1 Tax=Labedaea rhizosphaerae TaxID=598644 RepID=A0A4R6S6Z3_LABRH|nr:MFS transporter [Labedaea rhizosphaerae]TDP95133.1 putative MFS family arabinose efflux permease [Labedaea rhizosphaerae]